MKLFIIAASLALIISTANATVHIVTCQNTPSHFLPLTVNAMVGDTIRWIWMAGNHITGPIDTSDIPSGAAMWNGPIDAGNISFEYVLTVAGSYHYDCHPATPHGEDAYLEVTMSPSGLGKNNALSNLTFVYPNPTNGMFQFAIEASQITKKSKVEIYNLKGQIIYQSGVTEAISTIDLSNQSIGIYFLKFYSGQAILTKKIVID